MSDSPIEQLLEEFHKLDVDGAVALFAPDVQVLLMDGSRGEGVEPARELMTSSLGQLRAAAYQVTAQWHVDDTWIAEVEATYELRDYLELESIPRLFVVRANAAGIVELRIYGAHERRLAEHGSPGEGGVRVGGRWMPPL